MQIVRYHTGDQFVHAVRGEDGRKYIPLVYITDGGVVLRHVPLTESRHMAEIDYPIKRARRRMLAAGKRLGITKAAIDMLAG